MPPGATVRADMAHRSSACLVLVAAALAACGSPSPSTPPTVPPQPPATPPSAPAKPPEDPAEIAHRAALAEVAKLIAEADNNLLLTAWTGPYGGVPPWD